MMRNVLKYGAFALVVWGAVDTASGLQQVLRTHYGVHGNLRRVHGIGDVDQDGIEDYAITERGVWVYSGASGALVRFHFGESWSSIGESVASVSDFDGDGVEDYAVGRPGNPNNTWPGGAFYVFSGADGSELLYRTGQFNVDFRLGTSVVGIGDITGDGVSEIAVSTNQGYVRIYRGGNGELVRSHFGDGGFTQDAQVDGLGDVNDDGRGDYVIGYRGHPAAGSRAGAAFVYSGRTGGVLHEVYGEEDRDWLGRSVSNAGDMDGDGVNDFWVSAPGREDSFHATLNPGKPGFVSLHSGATGGLLDTLESRNFLLAEHSDGLAGFGESVLGGKDFNADGVPDVLIAASNEGYNGEKGGSVNLICGATGQRVLQEWGDALEGLWVAREGYSAILGDLDGDGYREWAVLYPDPNYDYVIQTYGRIRILRGAPGGSLRTCTAGINSTGVGARIEFPYSISPLSDATRVQALNTPVGETGVFFYGTPGPSQPFGDGELCIGSPTFRLLDPVASMDNGVALVDPDLNSQGLAFGVGALVAGSTWRFQYWYRDPAGGGAGFNLSDALDVTFAP